MKDVTTLEKEVKKLLEVLHLFGKWWDKDSKADWLDWDFAKGHFGSFLIDYGAREFAVANGRIFLNETSFKKIFELKNNQQIIGLCEAAVKTKDERIFKRLAIDLIKQNIMIIEEMRNEQEFLDEMWWDKERETKSEWAEHDEVLYNGQLDAEGLFIGKEGADTECLDYALI